MRTYKKAPFENDFGFISKFTLSKKKRKTIRLPLSIYHLVSLSHLFASRF